MTTRLIFACLALVAAHISGTLNDTRSLRDHHSLGGPTGWKATTLFFVAAFLMVPAVH